MKITIIRTIVLIVTIITLDGCGGGTNSSDDSGTPINSNQPPVANIGVLNIFSGAPAQSILAASDPEGDTLSYQIVVNGSLGTATITNINSGEYTYTPNPGVEGTDVFTFKVNDGVGDSNIAVVTVHIEFDDAPVANNNTYTLNEGAILNIATASGLLANDSDDEGQPLSAILVTNVAHGVLTLNSNGSFVYAHDGGETTSDSFTYKANDSGQDSNTATVTLIINPDNDLPVASNDAYTVSEGGSVGIGVPGVLAGDTDADNPFNSLGAILIDNAFHGVVLLNNNGSFIYQHDGTETTLDSFTYRASDGVDVSNPAFVTITVIPVNDPPIANNDDTATNEDTPVTISILSNDSDIDGALDFSGIVITSMPGHGNVVINGNGSVTYTPVQNYFGADSFQYKVADMDGGISQPADVNITVVPVNDLPTANAGPDQNVPENTVVNLSGMCTDIEGCATYQWTQIAGPAVTISNTGILNPGFAASEVSSNVTLIFRLTVTDNNGAQVSDTVSIAIENIIIYNDGVITINPAIAPGDLLAVSVTDPDLNNSPSIVETVSVSVVNNATSETETLLLTETGVNTWIFTNTLATTPGATAGTNNNGSLNVQIGNTITATYNDLQTSGGGTASIQANCTVVSSNSPISRDDEYSARRNSLNTVLNVLGNDSDPNNGSLTIISVTAPDQNGTVQIINGNSLSYTPNSGFLGLETFSYTVRNSVNRTSTAMVTVMVIPEITPHIIYILADDMGYQDLGIYGSPNISTPNLDRMAREGIRFTDFYGATTCGPYRAGLMTGSYAARAGMTFSCTPSLQTSVDVGINPNEVTIPEILRDRGYTTKIVGKWHLGDHPQFLPVKHGFQSFYGLPYSSDIWPFHPLTCPSTNEDPRLIAARERVAITGCEGCGSSFCYPVGRFPDLPLYINEKISEVNPDQSTLTTRFTQQALQFIQQNKDGPFFLYMPLTAPHVPLAPSTQFLGTSQRGLYGDVVQEIDWNVGQILDKLKQVGIDQNTLVIFTSDNGPWLAYGIDSGSAGPLRDGKGSQFEGGVRVPMIMRWPGYIPAGTVSSQIAHHSDILPTFASLAGTTPPADRVIDGINIWPVMAGQQNVTPHEYIMYYRDDTDLKFDDQTKALEAIRRGKWKLFITLNNLTVSGSALYNLETDLGETTNVISQNPSIVQQMVSIAQQFNDEMRQNSRPLGIVDTSLPQLYGSTHVPATNSVTLSANSPLDWAHWGLSTASRYNHKANVAQPITDVTILGSSPVNVYNSSIDISRGTYSWSGGTPTGSASNTRGYIYIRGQSGDGFEFQLPANTTQKTLRIYLGVDHARGKLEAILSDNSAPSFVTFVNNPDRVDNRMAVINFKASSNGQLLTIRYVIDDNYASINGTGGSISLSAMTVNTN